MTASIVDGSAGALQLRNISCRAESGQTATCVRSRWSYLITLASGLVRTSRTRSHGLPTRHHRDRRRKRHSPWYRLQQKSEKVTFIRKGQPLHSLVTEKLHAFAYRRQHGHIPLWRADKAARRPTSALLHAVQTHARARTARASAAHGHAPPTCESTETQRARGQSRPELCRRSCLRLSR